MKKTIQIIFAVGILFFTGIIHTEKKGKINADDAAEILINMQRASKLMAFGNDAIKKAIKHKKNRAVKFLQGLQKEKYTGADLNTIIIREDGSRLVHLLAENGLLSYIGELKKKYALDLKVKNNMQQTPAMVAIAAKHPKVANFLLTENAQSITKNYSSLP
ncbi:hypothetical protein HYX58_05670 [Candidatus Dependentiae bacterium]|nr:hypothetical protein [Candidatus Dependentiae bacterium]